MAYNKFFDSISTNTSSDGSVFVLNSNYLNFERFKINTNFIVNDLNTKITASNTNIILTGSLLSKNNLFLKDEIISNSNIKIGDAIFSIEGNKVSGSLSNGIFDFSEFTGSFSNSSNIITNLITGSLENINDLGDKFFETSDDSNIEYNLGWSLSTGRRAPTGNIIKIGFDSNGWQNVSTSDIVDYRDNGNNLNFRNDELEETNILYFRPGWTNGSPDLEYLGNLFDGAFFKFEITGANGVLPGWSTGSNNILHDVSEYANLGISNDVKMQNQTIMIDLSDAVDNNIISQDYEIFFEFHDHEIPPIVTHALWHSKSDDDGVGYSFPNSSSIGNSNAFNNNDFCFTSMYCHPEDTYYQNNKNNNIFGKEELGKLMYFTLFDSSTDGNVYENKHLPVTHTGTSLVTSKPRLLLNLGQGSTINHIEDVNLTKRSLYLQRVYNDSGITKEPVISNDQFISAGEVSSYQDSNFNVTFNAFFNPTNNPNNFNHLIFQGFGVTSVRFKMIYSKSAIKNKNSDGIKFLNYNRIFPCKIYDNFIAGDKITLDDIPSNIKSRLPSFNIIGNSYASTYFDSNNKLAKLNFTGTVYDNNTRKKYLNLDLCSRLKEGFYNKLVSDWPEYLRTKDSIFNNVNNKISNNISLYRNINNLSVDSGLRINKLNIHIPHIKIKESSNTYNHLNNFSNQGSIYSLNNFVNSFSNYAQMLNPCSFTLSEGQSTYKYISDSFIQGEWLQFEKNNFSNTTYNARSNINFGSFLNLPARGYHGGFILNNGLNRPDFIFGNQGYHTIKIFNNTYVDDRASFKKLSGWNLNGITTGLNYFEINTTSKLVTNEINSTSPYRDNLSVYNSPNKNYDFLASKMPLDFKNDIELISSLETDPTDKMVYRFKLTLTDSVNKIWTLTPNERAPI